MGKNYTLYINQDNFNQEKNKSGLVNRLLSRHYKSSPDPIAKSNVIPMTLKPIEGMRLPQIEEPVSRDITDTALVCPDGNLIPEGRDKCMNKQCKSCKR